MDPSPSPEAQIAPAEAELLLDIAETTIQATLAGLEPALPPLPMLPDRLHAPAGAFVTLTVAGQLNGCIGDVEGTEPLGHAVARLALAAAFGDPRLPALRPEDLPELTIELSLLSPLSAIDVNSRDELLDELRPETDGLVVAAGVRRGLFLPAVWEQLPDADDFLDHLFVKAGLIPRTWPAGVTFFRFTTLCHERRAAATGPNPRIDRRMSGKPDQMRSIRGSDIDEKRATGRARPHLEHQS